MRLQINIADSMVEQIDYYAKEMGVSRSALCATFIGQGVMAYNTSFSVLRDAGEQIVNASKEELGK